MSAWPGDLPQEQFIGTSVQRETGMIRTNMDVGPAKTRRRFTACVIRVQCPLVLTNSQKSVFNAFYRDTLQEGTLPFDWSDPLADSLVSYRFVSAPQFRLVRGDSNSDISTRLWQTTLVLEILP